MDAYSLRVKPLPHVVRLISARVVEGEFSCGGQSAVSVVTEHVPTLLH